LFLIAVCVFYWKALKKCVKNVDQGFTNRVNSKGRSKANTSICVTLILSVWNISSEMSMALATCKTTLVVIIQLCQRNSRRMDEFEREVSTDVSLQYPLLTCPFGL
jgi:hypothetical protein